MLDFLLFRPTLWALGVTFGRASSLLVHDDWGNVALWVVFGLTIAWLLWMRTPADRRRAPSYRRRP